MFTVTANPTFRHTVKVKVPTDGGFVDQDFETIFNVLPITVTSRFDLTNGESSSEFLRAIVVRMNGLVDDADKELPWSDALRDQMIANPYVRKALVNTYFAAIGGASLGN